MSENQPQQPPTSNVVCANDTPFDLWLEVAVTVAVPFGADGSMGNRSTYLPSLSARPPLLSPWLSLSEYAVTYVTTTSGSVRTVTV